MSVYAKDTVVSVEKSRAEIESILARYGASHFAYATMPGVAQLAFQIPRKDKTVVSVKMTLPLPAKDDKRFKFDGRGAWRSDEGIHKAWEQACRSAWRAMCLIVKAKLEAVSSGISTLEREFMADLMLPNGQTLSESVLPQLSEMYRIGGAPRLALTGRVEIESDGDIVDAQIVSKTG